MRQRLDTELARRGLVASRSQAESYIRLGKVFINGRSVTKPGFLTSPDEIITLDQDEQYVSRAALKLASVTTDFKIDFEAQVVLDVGSSTGGFTDYSLRHGAKKVIAVDVGTNQLHPSLRTNKAVELHEQTDIREVKKLSSRPDIVVIDVSFISLRQVLPHLTTLITSKTQVIAMVKPQFEAGSSAVKHKGIIKNEAMRRKILKDFEIWVKDYFVIIAKKDSSVAGEKGNQERFYLLKHS